MKKLKKDLEKLRSPWRRKKLDYFEQNSKLFKEYKLNRSEKIRNKIITKNIAIILNVVRNFLFKYELLNNEEIECQALVETIEFSCKFIDANFKECWIESPFLFYKYLVLSNYQNLKKKIINKNQDDNKEVIYLEDIVLTESEEIFEEADTFETEDFYTDWNRVGNILKPREYFIINKYFLEETPSKEISKQLDLTVSYINMIKGDGLSKIREDKNSSELLSKYY